MELQEYPKIETSRLMSADEEVDCRNHGNEYNGKSGVFVKRCSRVSMSAQKMYMKGLFSTFIHTLLQENQ